MKKILIFIASLAASFSTFAATATYNPDSTNAVSVVTGRQGSIAQITFANSAVSGTTVTLFDAPTNVLTWVSGLYTNNTLTVSTNVQTYTNFYNIVERWTNVVQSITATAVPAATNFYPTVYTYVVPASTSQTVTFVPRTPFMNGLAAITSATNVIVTISYVPGS